MYVKTIVDPLGIIGPHYISSNNQIFDGFDHNVGHLDGNEVILDYKKHNSISNADEIVKCRGIITNTKLKINGRELEIQDYQP